MGGVMGELRRTVNVVNTDVDPAPLQAAALPVDSGCQTTTSALPETLVDEQDVIVDGLGHTYNAAVDLVLLAHGVDGIGACVTTVAPHLKSSWQQ